MRKPYFMVNRKSAVRMGAVLSLTICMALQTAGCSSAGKGGEQTTAAQADGDVKEAAGTTAGNPGDGQTGGAAGKDAADKDKTDAGQDAGEAAAKDKAPEGAGQTDGEAAAGETRPDAGEAAADETQADAGQGEGDSGIEAQPGVPLKAGNKAPDFTAELIDGSSLALSDLKGKPVIINFWATWCPPCKAEMPDIQKLYEKSSTEGEDAVIVLGVAAPNMGQEGSEEEIAAFMEEKGYTYPVLMDTEGELFNSYGIMSFPTTFMIDRDGNVFGYVSGMLSADMMDSIVRQTLDGKVDQR